ncbi:MAG: M20 metallopeptidase family protein [Nannocystales bacterium]
MSNVLFSAQALDERLETLVPELTEARHDIHQHPELGFEETRTQAKVKAYLEALGYAPRVSAETGLIADVRPDLGAPRLALRADLDCLPMQEDTDLPYKSVHAGRAHKCGHDGHTAVLMGVAKMLSEVRDSLSANVRLLFQPAEEGVRGGGAKVMVAEGALEGVQEVYALHNWPGYPHGQVRVRAGAMMAATAEFDITLTGVGGHGSQPQLCRDPIVAAAAMINALQTVVSRGISSDGGAVLSVCTLHSGTAHNVIPSEARLGGTVRTFSESVTETVFSRLEEVVRGTAAALGVEAELEVRRGYPVLVNDSGCAESVARVARTIVGPERVTDADLPMAGGEDFAYMAQAIPGAYFFLGTGNEELTTPVCHHPDFDFDDAIIPLGLKMFMGLIEDRLGLASVE